MSTDRHSLTAPHFQEASRSVVPILLLQSHNNCPEAFASAFPIFLDIITGLSIHGHQGLA